MAKCKNGAELMKKYPTEDAFFAAFPEALNMVKAQNGFTPPYAQNPIDPNYVTNPNQDYIELNDQELNENNGYAFSGGPNTNNNSMFGKMSPNMASNIFSSVGDIANSFNAENRYKNELKQENGLLRGMEQLSNTPDVNLPLQKHVLDRPENYIASTNSFYPSQGTGYDILRATGRNGLNIRRAQNGLEELPYDDPYGLQQEVPTQVRGNSEDYASTRGYDNSMYTEEPLQAISPAFDSKSARDNWVQKTGLPWSEAKRLGYTNGSAKDNTKLLAELNDPRFKKENLRTTAPKSSSRTPVQHTDTPTGKLTPIKKPLTMDEYFKGKPKYNSNTTVKQSTQSGYDRELESKRKQKEFASNLYGERVLTYMEHPSKAIGDLRSVLNPMFTPDSETSESDRKEVMANRYNPTLTKAQKVKNVTKMGLKKVPRATVNTATALSMAPYTTLEAMPIGIGQGVGRNVGNRAAGYIGEGAKQLMQGAPKMLNQPYTPNFVMYQDGGYVPIGQNGYAQNDDDTQWNNTPSNQQGNFGDMKSFATSAMGNMFNNNAGSQFSKLPGVAGIVGGFLGGAADDMFGPAGKIKSLQRDNTRRRNSIVQNTAWQNIPTSPFRQSGGNVSSYDDQEIEQYADGGELQTHWGGEVAPVSYNPFSEGDGLTYKAYGNSHSEKDGQGRTGIGLSVGQNGEDMGQNADVEIEDNEAISMTDDGAFVAGALIQGKDLIEKFNLPLAYKNKTAKKIVNDIIVPQEQKYTKALEKIVSSTNTPNTAFDMLSEKTNEAKKRGYEMRLKALAEDKKNIAASQEYVHKTADYLSNILGREVSEQKFAKNGEVSHTLAKGELSKNAQNGTTLGQAQKGKVIKGTGDKWDYMNIGDTYNSQWQDKSSYYSKWVPRVEEAFKDEVRAKKMLDYIMNYNDPNALKVRRQLANFTTDKEKLDFLRSKAQDEEIGVIHNLVDAGISATEPTKATVPTVAPVAPVKDEEITPIEETPKKGFPWGAVASNALRMFEKPFNMPLDNSQIMPELYSLANNRPEGMYVPHINSMLETPYKYSANPDRNSIMSQFRTASKMSGNNASAQAALMGQTSQAMDQIGSKELEVNQQTEQGVYNRNIGTINSDRVRNAGIDYDAMTKWSEALSKTKATTIENLKSLAEKEATNKADNFKANTLQAMHPDYTFNNYGQVIKRPRYIEFDTSGKGPSSSKGGGNLAEGYEYTYDASGNIIGTRRSSKASDDAMEAVGGIKGKNGLTIKKKNTNGGIVNAFKNL